MRSALRLASLSLSCIPCACASTPAAVPPEQAAPKIVALLDAGKSGDADELFAAEEREPSVRDGLYPLLYEQARGRFERGETTGAAAILRFMARAYPKSIAVREALVYALFVERAGSAQPPPELVQEMGTVIATLEGADVPPWVELARAQEAIDGGKPGTAREALARFQRANTDSTPEIVLYAEDIERYLQTQPR